MPLQMYGKQVKILYGCAAVRATRALGLPMCASSHCRSDGKAKLRGLMLKSEDRFAMLIIHFGWSISANWWM